MGAGFGAGNAMTVPLFHTNFLPLLIHVNFFPATTALLPAFGQRVPAFGVEAAVAGRATIDSRKSKGSNRFIRLAYFISPTATHAPTAARCDQTSDHHRCTYELQRGQLLVENHDPSDGGDDRD